ncbi:hypothetical protein [Microvirga arsenatis]|uniref:Calcium-binding protein n=1 Tax=Microvirga arsenatis TaxID=2692265 RepID=A0ABW9Z2Z7_9HYPH|nr:hypothetical protein [Microvirga arsenatis]NBJ11483.1 hypothetical protein [Microvirga arsenatis]NBJ26321.1 hypothetical protein [Microvirga arsenatis]
MFLTIQSVFKPQATDVIKPISTSANGALTTAVSYKGQFSANGRYVVFESSDSNLVAADTNNEFDVFRKDLATGAIVRVSISGAGEANSESRNAQVSADGRYVVFESYASNLVAGDTPNTLDIFRKDLVTGEIVRVSAVGATAANGASANAQISADGNLVLFESDASNLVGDDTNGARDIFIKNLTTGDITRLSTAGTKEIPIQGNGSSSRGQISDDGRYVIFESIASNLVANDTPNTSDIFRKDLVTGEVVRVSVDAAGVRSPNKSYSNGQVSANGQYVVFQDGADIFLKDIATGALSPLSTEGGLGKFSRKAQISTDGRYIIFESWSTFGTDDVDQSLDVFLKDMATGTITLLSSTTDGSLGTGMYGGAQISADGRYALFNNGGDDAVSHVNIHLVDLFYKSHAAAITEGRFIEVKLGTGAASSATIAWDDGTTSTVVPVAGSAAFSHAYASTGAKAATVTLTEGALTWSVAHTIDIASGTMARNTALADTLSGGAGSDILTGDAFANILIANEGNDRLNGGTGNDSLDGGVGNDVFSAGDGNDRLVGGLGRDTLTGSTGRDVFVFDDRETASSKTKADTITDFSGRRGDRIDLKLVDANARKRGDQKFSFIGDDEAFTAAGQVRYEKTKGTTYVYLNTDSDRAAEAVIKLKGAMDLSKSWFVL